MIYDLVVVGGGAAGFYGAIQAAELKPGLRVLLLEKSNKVLSKVKVSGGGRCNVTHHCPNSNQFAKHYPRGEQPLKSVFRQHSSTDTIAWFSQKGVQLKIEEDGRMFPDTDSSQTIIDCLVKTALKLGVEMRLSEAVVNAFHENEIFTIRTAGGKVYHSKALLVAQGGSPALAAYNWIKDLGHSIVPLMPSLFTFNDADQRFRDLMGLSVPDALIKITGTKFLQNGPVLVTHWGLSGPAVIKLSAWAALHLHSVGYDFNVLVSWLGEAREDDVRSALKQYQENNRKQKVERNPLYGLPARLWTRLCELAEIPPDKIWAELPLKNLNRLLEMLIRCPFHIKGKTTFKEEFVTCGGVDLQEVDVNTMESKLMPNLFFAGEVLNIDGETGGFNFQAAWSTSYVAARAIASRFGS